MSTKTRVLAVISFFGALCLAFYLGTRWGPPSVDVISVQSPNSEPRSTVTPTHIMDVDKSIHQGNGEQETFGEGELLISAFCDWKTNP
jgi:hypothetical protein